MNALRKNRWNNFFNHPIQRHGNSCKIYFVSFSCNLKFNYDGLLLLYIENSSFKVLESNFWHLIEDINQKDVSLLTIFYFCMHLKAVRLCIGYASNISGSWRTYYSSSGTAGNIIRFSVAPSMED